VNRLLIGSVIFFLLFFSVGFQQAFASHGAGHTYPDPYLYIDFDSNNITPNGFAWKNLGTAGSVANAIMLNATDEMGGFENTTISVAAETLNATGLLGQAVHTNDTADGLEESSGARFVQFGNEANRAQWQFLHENSDDGTGSFGSRGADFTTITFWSNGDVSNTVSTAIQLLSQGSVTNAGTNSHQLYVRLDGTPDDRLSVRIDNDDTVFPGKFANENSLQLTHDGAWHMVSMRYNKMGTPSLELCIDGTTSCTTASDFAFSYDATVGTVAPRSFLLAPPPDVLILGSVSEAPPSWNVDEFAVWKELLLTDAEINFLWNEGDGNRVLGVGEDIFVGGTLIPIGKTSLLLAGAQMTAVWLIPFIVAAIGIGIVILRKY